MPYICKFSNELLSAFLKQLFFVIPISSHNSEISIKHFLNSSTKQFGKFHQIFSYSKHQIIPKNLWNIFKFEHKIIQECLAFLNSSITMIRKTPFKIFFIWTSNKWETASKIFLNFGLKMIQKIPCHILFS